MNCRLLPAGHGVVEAGASEAVRSQAGAWERGFPTGDWREVWENRPQYTGWLAPIPLTNANVSRHACLHLVF